MKITVLFFAFTVLAQAQLRVTVPANRVITLAGQPAGTRSTNQSRSAPGDSPIPVNLPLTPGQAVEFTATGAVDGAGPDGRPNCRDSYSAEFSVAAAIARCRSLVGVFLADTTRTQPGAPLDFSGDGSEIAVVRPMLQQPFGIGAGITSTGQRKAFVVPAGATRLFLSPIAFPTSTGEFTVTVRIVPVPGVPTNPVRVSAIAVPQLAGQPLGATSTNQSRIAGLYSPEQAVLPLIPGQALRIVATGAVDGAGPEGRINCRDSYSAEYAVAAAIARCRALVGVFLSDTTRAQPPSVDYSGAARNNPRVEPLLQQPFLVGSGYTDSGDLKQFIVPAGATRLYFAPIAFPTSVGSFLVTVSPEASSTPTVQRSGIVRAAGFAGGAPAAGSIVSIFGGNLGDSSLGATSVPLPEQLGATRVYFNLRPAPLFFAGTGQVNVQVPWELANETSVQVVVVRNGAASLPVPLPLAAASPGIFLAGANAGVVVNGATGQLVDERSGVKRGDVIVVYASGLGPVNGSVTTGAPASSTELEPTRQPVQALLTTGGREASLAVVFAGSAPGFIGVNQVNAVIPADTPTGVGALKLRTAGADSNEVPLAIQP